MIIDVEDMVKSAARRFRAPGLSVAAILPSGRTIHLYSGFRDLVSRDALSSQTKFGIGSISKTLTAVVIHQLDIEGAIDLDRTPAAYLGADIVDSIPNATIAPLRTLLDHTSGIPSWEFDRDWIRRARGSRYRVGDVFGPLDSLWYIRHGRHSSTNLPGAKYHYSNSNHTLLGLIVEIATGAHLGDQVRERILDVHGLNTFVLHSFDQQPLGIVANGYHRLTDFFRSTAGVHHSWSEVAPGVLDVGSVDLSPEWAAGGYVATVEDLAYYGERLNHQAFGSVIGRRLKTFRTPVGLPAGNKMMVSPGLFLYRSSAGSVMGHFGGTLGYCAAVLLPYEQEGPVVALAMNIGYMHTAEAESDEQAAWKGWVLDELYPAIQRIDE